MNTNEIVKALRCMHAFEGAPSDMTCGDCEYYESFSGTIVDSEDDGCPGLCNGKFCVQAADTIERLQKELDAAVWDIAKDCEHCKYEKEDYPDNAPHCDKCMKPRINNCGVYCSHSQWQWRGRESEGQVTAFIKTDETTGIIQADTLIIEPNEPHLFAYNGEILVGVWRMADVKSAYLTEGRK